MISKKNKLKAIVVGLGNIALRHRRNLKLLYPEITIIAVPTTGKITKQNIDFADQIILSLEDAIKENADISIIASPAPFHATHAKQLLFAKIPILVEKPITSNVLEAKELLKIKNQTKTPICVGYCLRYLPSSLKMKKLIEHNTIGYIYNATICAGQYLPDWRSSINFKNSVSAKKHLGGGVLFELSHEIDYIQWLLGPMKVHYAKLRSSSELNLEVEEIVDAVLVSDTGTICNLHLDFLQKKVTRSCSFIGEKGRLDWDLLTNTIELHTKHNTVSLFNEPNYDYNDMYLCLLKDFFRLMEGLENTAINIEEAAKTVELIEIIKHFASKGLDQ